MNLTKGYDIFGVVSSFVGMELTWEGGITPFFYSSESEKNSSTSVKSSLLSISSKRVLISIP